MGRTNPTYRDLFRNWREDDLSPWRRGLRRPEQQRWDRLLDDAERYSVAGDNLNLREPRWSFLYAIVLALQKRCDEQADRIEHLEAALDTEDSPAT